MVFLSVYTNTLLATLNARQSLRDDVLGNGVMNSIHLSNVVSGLEEELETSSNSSKPKGSGQKSSLIWVFGSNNGRKP